MFACKSTCLGTAGKEMRFFKKKKIPQKSRVFTHNYDYGSQGKNRLSTFVPAHMHIFRMPFRIKLHAHISLSTEK